MASTNNIKITSLDELDILSGNEWLPISAKQGISDEIFNSYRVSVDAIKDYVANKYDVNALRNRYNTYYSNVYTLGAYTYDSYPELRKYLEDVSTYVDDSITYLDNAYTYLKTSYNSLYNFAIELFGSLKLTGKAGTDNSYQIEYTINDRTPLPVTIPALGEDPKALSSTNINPGIVSKNFVSEFANTLGSSGSVADLTPVGGNPDISTYGTVYIHDVVYNAGYIKHPIYVRVGQSSLTNVAISYRAYTYSSSSLKTINLPNATNTAYGMVTLGKLCEYVQTYINPIPEYHTKSYSSTYTYTNRGLLPISSTNPDRDGFANEPLLEEIAGDTQHNFGVNLFNGSDDASIRIQLTAPYRGIVETVLSESSTDLLKSGLTTYGVTTLNYIDYIQRKEIDASLTNTPKFNGTTYGVATDDDIKTYARQSSPDIDIRPDFRGVNNIAYILQSYYNNVLNGVAQIPSLHSVNVTTGIINFDSLNNKIQEYFNKAGDDKYTTGLEIYIKRDDELHIIQKYSDDTQTDKADALINFFDRTDYRNTYYGFISKNIIQNYAKTYINTYMGK